MLKASVILPTRNRAASLREALGTLSKQSLPREHFEVIVVDDGSSDDTPAVLAEPWPFRLRTIRHSNKGAVESRNIAAEAAAGDLLVFVDDDVWLDARYLEATLALHAKPEPRLGMGSLLPDDERARSAFHRIYARENADPQPFPAETEVPFTACVTNNLSVRKDVFYSLGMFRNPVGDGPGTWTDVELGCRAYRAGIRCWRSGSAICIHRDYSIDTFATARKRAYRVARASLALFDAHPWCRDHISMFDDKWPVEIGADDRTMVVRKIARRAKSAKPVVWVMERTAEMLVAWFPAEVLLRPLYRWILGAVLLEGLRDGLREAGGFRVGQWSVDARTVSKG